MIDRSRNRTHKFCPRCKNSLPLGDFNKASTAQPNRYQPYCRTCQQEYTREWRVRRNDKELYRQERNTPEGARLWLRKRVAVYGLTLEDYERMYASQSGSCSICLTPHNVLCVDHDHQTGRVRALLCKPCNSGIGLLREDPERMRRAAEYVLKHRV